LLRSLSVSLSQLANHTWLAGSGWLTMHFIW
jgi:hypothetical protein